jgi:hypothetical protein
MQKNCKRVCLSVSSAKESNSNSCRVRLSRRVISRLFRTSKERLTPPCWQRAGDAGVTYLGHP